MPLLSAFFSQTAGQLPSLVLVGWFVGLCVLVSGFGLLRNKSSAEFNWVCREPWSPGEFVVLVCALVVAGAYRGWNLYEYPALLHNDEMAVGLAVRKLVERPDTYLFGTGWSGLPQLSYYYSGFMIFLFGDSLLSLRMGSVVLGTLSLLGAYLFARLLAGKQAAQLLLILAIPFHWAVHISRTGHHYIQATFFSCWALWGFLAAVSSGRLIMAALVAVFIALSIHGYFASRIIIVAVSVYWLYLIWRSGEQRVWLLKFAAVFWIVFAYALIPTIFYFAAFPHILSERTNSVVIYNPTIIRHMKGVAQADSLFDLALYQLMQPFGLFHLYRDKSQQYGYFNPFAKGVLFIPSALALLYGFSRFLKPAFFFTLSFFTLTLLVGGTLTVDPPFTPRLAPLAILWLLPVAFAFSDALDRCAQNKWTRLVAGTLLIVFSGFYVWQQYDLYFLELSRHTTDTRRDYIARYVDEQDDVKYLVNLGQDRIEKRHEAFTFLVPEVTIIEEQQEWRSLVSLCGGHEFVLMSDSPLKVEGELAGAGLYSVQRFITTPKFRIFIRHFVTEPCSP